MISNIQILRALAAAMVILVHCQTILQPLGVPERVSGAFASGVDLFFVISGFIMVHTTRSPSPSPATFMLNRAVRVVPLYWFLTLLTFALALVAPSLLGATKANAVALLKSLLFIPYVRDDGTMRPILFLGWSLNYEMFFYAIFACGLVIRRDSARIAATIAVLVLLVLLGAASGGDLPVELAFLTRPIILEFALGMILAAVYPALPKTPLAGRVAITVALASIPLLVVTSLLQTTALPIVAIPAAALLASMLVLHQSGVSVCWRPLVLLGDASYSLYLTHPFVVQAITKVAVRSVALSPTASLIILLAIYLCSFAVAMASYYFLERPMSRLLRRLVFETDVGPDRVQRERSAGVPRP